MKILRLMFSIAMIFALSATAWAKKQAEPETASYEIEGVSRSVSDGGAIVKVTLLVKDKEKVDHKALGRAAVHGVLFKGYSNPKGAAHRPLCGSPMDEMTYAEFFQPFFDNDMFSGYVQCMDETRRVVKVGKEFRVSCNVVVSESMLRKDLQKQGIIKSLNSGW